MKRLSLLALMVLSLAAGSGLAADKPEKTTKVVQQDWKGAPKSMAEKGRFHKVHAQKEKLDCEDCHDKDASDPLFLRAGEFQAKEGDVDRNGCLTCHASPKKPTFYLGSK
jgi:hypothetical protein